MSDPIFLELLLVIAVITLIRRKMLARIQQHSVETESRFMSTALLRKYRQFFGVDRLYVFAQVSNYVFFALVLAWIFVRPGYFGR